MGGVLSVCRLSVMRSPVLTFVALLALSAPAWASHQTPPKPKPAPSGPYLSVAQAKRMTAALASKFMHDVGARSFFVGACDRPAPNRLNCRVDFYGTKAGGCVYTGRVVKTRSRTRAALRYRAC